GLDPSDPKAYSIAGAMGCKNKKKVKNLRRKYLEQKGLTDGRLFDLYNDMMIERKDVNMLYSLAEDFETSLPNYKQVVGPKILNQNNTQINGDVQIDFTNLKNE